MPTPSPRVAENANRTFTVGSSQFLSLSLLLRLWSNCWTRSRSTGRISAGELQDCNWVARGWVTSLFFVVFSYVSKAALKTDWKSADEDEEGAAEAVRDMVLVGRNQSVPGRVPKGDRAISASRVCLCVANFGTRFPLAGCGTGTGD